MPERALVTLLALSLAGPALATSPWSKAQAAPRTAADLHREHGEFMAATGRPQPALTTLRRRQADGPTIAALYAELGLAEQALAALRDHGGGPEASTAWLRLARLYYRRGDYQRAKQALLQIPLQLSNGIALERASLLARVLIHQGQYDEAVLALLAQRRRDSLTPIDQYNLGVAQLLSGDTTRGAAQLEELGGYRGDDPARAVLADQANLKLGYWFLRDSRGGLARHVLQRIRLDGPYADQATLALGWAELAPAGDVQRLYSERPAECGAPQPNLWDDAPALHAVPRQACRNLELKEREQALGGEAARESTAAEYRRAAVAWRETLRFPITRAATQEALVALPYALARAGDQAQAMTAYENAIDRLSAAVQERPSGESARLPPRIMPEDRLARLQAVLVEDHARLAALEQRLAHSPDPAEARARLVARLGEVLAQLRDTPTGRPVRQPDAVQRARLRALVDSLAAQPVDSRAHRERIRALNSRVADLRRQVDAIRTKLDGSRQRLARERRRQLHERLTLYLEQARLGLAAVLD